MYALIGVMSFSVLDYYVSVLQEEIMNFKYSFHHLLNCLW